MFRISWKHFGLWFASFALLVIVEVILAVRISLSTEGFKLLMGTIVVLMLVIAWLIQPKEGKR